MRSPESRPGHRPGRMFEEELNLRYLSPGAFTVLSPEDHGPSPDPPAAPPPYRLSPNAPRRNKNQAFSIIAEPVRSRSPSPTPGSGRVSPFRGRGFNPTGSRHASPQPSPPPPEDSRLRTYQKNTNNRIVNNNIANNAKKSQIPQLKREVRRSHSIIFTGEDSDGSPKYQRKNGTALKPELSKSLNYIGPKNVSYKPPPSPKRPPGLYSKSAAFSRLSPIIGSSPEPSSDAKSQSSPASRIPKSRSTPPSRKPSPTRDDSSPDYRRSTSRLNSRNASRDNSPSNGKPPFSPTRIPVRNYKNVQAKVNSNSNNAKSNTNQPKVPTKTQELRSRMEESKKVRRNESVKNVSKNSTAAKKYGSNNNISKVGNSKNSNNNNNVNKSTRNSNLKASKKVTRKDDKDKDNNNTSPKKNNAERTNNSSSNNKSDNDEKSKTSVTNSAKNDTNKNATKNAPNKTSTNETEDSKKTSGDSKNPPKPTKKSESSNSLLKKAEDSTPKLQEMLLPSATTVVSTTTSTVTQPLKIDAKMDTSVTDSKAAAEQKPKKETPMYMDEDSQTLLKDHNMSKLSPAASAIISMSNETNQSNAVPSVETVQKTAANNTNVSNAGANNNANNMNKLISPDDSFGAKVNNYGEKSANERMMEARTMVAKPIQITVQEKPNDVEVQSGNVRFPPNATNGINSASGVPPAQGENGNQPQEEEAPKSRCQTFMEKCRSKMPCACCKPKMGEEKTPGCFGCLKKKKKEVEEIIVTDADEVEAAKKSCLERLKCCRSNKVGDSTTGCCGRLKRKDSWADRRDSILSEQAVLTRGQKCKNFFKALFCCCGCSACCRKKPPKIETSASRRASMMSKKKSLTPTVLPPEDPKDKLDVSLVEYTSTMKAAIPVLPVCLAYFCLIFNIFAPGTGTVFSGLFCLCMGKPRFSQKDTPKARFGSFLINIIIGCGQLFTVLFCLVGWGWSIWWGTIMLKVAKKHRKLKKIEERMEAQQEKEKAAGSSNQSRRDVEKGRS